MIGYYPNINKQKLQCCLSKSIPSAALPLQITFSHTAVITKKLKCSVVKNKDHRTKYFQSLELHDSEFEQCEVML